MDAPLRVVGCRTFSSPGRCGRMPFTRIAQHSLVQKGSRAETADIAVAERLARDRRHGAMQVAGTLSEVGDQPPLLTLSGAVLALGLATGNAQRAETGARMLAAVVVATGIKSVLKHFVSRTRPHVLLYHLRLISSGWLAWATNGSLSRG